MGLTPEGKQQRDRCRDRIPHSPRYQTEPTKGCDCYWCSQPRVWTPEYRAEMERAITGDVKDDMYDLQRRRAEIASEAP